MKNLYKSILAVTAAAMAFAGCVKEQPLAPQNNEDTISLTIIADAQPENLTKTQMNQDETDVIWTDKERTNFYTDGTFLYFDPKNYEVVITPDHKLQATLHKVPANTQFIDGFFGAKYSKDAEIRDAQNLVTAFGITLPTVQNVTTSTFDPLADVLVMDRIDITGVDLKQPIAYATYHRLNAITKLSFTGLDTYASENVSSVEFTTTNAELTGEFSYDYVAKKFVDKNGVEKAGSVFNFNASKSVTMNFPSNTKLDANFAAWMVTAAQTLKAGEIIKVTISTDKHNFTASFKAPGDKVLTNTQLNTLTLNMSKATVTDQSQIVADGEYVIAVKDDSGAYYAMLAEDRLNDKFAEKPNDRLDFAKIENYTSGTYVTSNLKEIWTITKTATGFSIMNDGQSLKPGDNKSYIDGGNTIHEFTINKGTSGTYIILAEVTGKSRSLKKHQDYGFGFYSQLDNEVYLIPASETPNPRITFKADVFTVESGAKSLTIPFTRNKFAKGNVTVSATSEGDWLTVKPTTIEGPVSEITCSFEANTGAERTATLTVSHEGMADQTITVKQSAYVAPGTTKTYTLVVDSNNFKNINGGGGYAAYNGDHTFTVKSDDGTTTQTIVLHSTDVMANSSKVQFKKNSGVLKSVTSLGELISVEFAPTNLKFTVTKKNDGFEMKGGDPYPKADKITIKFKK